MSTDESQLEITSALASLVGNDADDLQSEYTQFHEWMVTKGMNPMRETPLKDTTAENYFERLDQAHRLIIQYLEPDDPVAIRHDHADDFVFLLDRDEIRKRDGDEYSESAKRKFAKPSRNTSNGNTILTSRRHRGGRKSCSRRTTTRRRTSSNIVNSGS